MSKKDDYGLAAEKLYVEAGKSIDEIASLLPVARKTIGDWCSHGNWVLKRRQRSLGPGAIVAKIQDAIETLLTGDTPMDASTADAIHKLNKTLQAYLKESESHFLTKAIEVMDRFIDRLCRKYSTPLKRRLFTDEIDEFFQELEDRH